MVSPSGSLKPLSGNVCLRPMQFLRSYPGFCRVSNPSRGTCAFGQGKIRALHVGATWSQTPLGERVPSAIASSGILQVAPTWSNTPLGERVPSARNMCGVGGLWSICLKPLSGNVCLRPVDLDNAKECALQSQTPLGERVPSAQRARSSPSGHTLSQTPLGERVPSALDDLGKAPVDVSQTPLGERVPSAERLPWQGRSKQARLKPLSGNVCLRPC